MIEGDILKKQSFSPSQRRLRIAAIGFWILFAVMLLNQLILGDVIVDVRMNADGPEMLFRGDSSLWVPTSWGQYTWHKMRVFILLPFGLIAVGIGYWHHWETTKAEETYD